MSRANKLVNENIQKESGGLKDELERLRRYLNYKNGKFCKKVLDEIIHNYFKN